MERAGKLLTTPSRLLKLIIPLSTLDKNTDRKDLEPLVLLVHPQQPLSYLERLIQSELPTIISGRDEGKIPHVRFLAASHMEDAVEPKTKHDKKDLTDEDMHDDVEEGEGGEKEEGEPVSTASRDVDSPSSQEVKQGQEESDPRPLIRWSTSTEIGDFIRDAARAHEFAIEIEGHGSNIPVGVPSFNDRTHYLRQRLRTTADRIKGLAALKKECDLLAHRGAQRVALAGAGLLVGYWYVVYRLTFETDLGWDTMEPVTVCLNPLSPFFPPALVRTLVRFVSDYKLTAECEHSTWWASRPSYVGICGSSTIIVRSLTGPP